MADPTKPGWYLVRRGAVGVWDAVEVISARGRMAISMPGWTGPAELPHAVYDGADWRGPFHPEDAHELARLRTVGDGLARAAFEALPHVGGSAIPAIADLADGAADRLRTALDAWCDVRDAEDRYPTPN